jgi:hypothetical protein
VVPHGGGDLRQGEAPDSAGESMSGPMAAGAAL